MRWILPTLLAALLAGCGALQSPDYGGERIDTPTEIAGQAEAELTAAYATVHDLLARDVITLEQAIEYRGQLNDVGNQLDTGRELLRLGQTGTAEDRLDAADAALGAIQRELEEQQR